MSTSSNCLNIVSKFLSNTFYNRITFSNPEIGIYYNSFMFDVISVIPIEFQEAIHEVSSFSDYICIISDATNKIDHSNKEIGIIYVDFTNQNLMESINIARLPALQKTDISERKKLLDPVLKDVYFPFWIHKANASIEENNSGIKNLEHAKMRIEKAISTYCEQNKVPRSEITSYSQFIDHIAPDIFKYKMTVAEELQLRKEAELLDENNNSYPEMHLKAITLLELA